MFSAVVFFLNLSRMLGTLSHSEIIINKSKKIRQWLWVVSYFHLLCNALNNQVYADEVQRDCFAPDKEIPEGAQSPGSTPSTFPLVVALWKPPLGWHSDVCGRGELVFDTCVEAGGRVADAAVPGASVWRRGLCAFPLACHLIRRRQKTSTWVPLSVSRSLESFLPSCSPLGNGFKDLSLKVSCGCTTC